MHDWRRALGDAVAGCRAELRFAEPMAKHTTFRIGGLADAWVRVDDRKALARVLQVCREAGVRTWLLGRGSNVLVSDQGLRGVVVCLGGEFCKIAVAGRSEPQAADLTPPARNPELEAWSLKLEVGAGAALDDVATSAEKEGLAGAEFLAGIPGTVGGGLHSNAGAFGRSLSDIVTSVTVLDTDGNELALTGAQIRREYRRPMIDDGLVVVEATLKLEEGPRARGSGGSAIRPESQNPGTREILTAEQVRQQRWAKHPAEPSAGSFFRNPERNGERIPAGRLIEQCGLKGRTVGGAKVSEKHANFLVNTGKARFADVYELVQVVKATVEEKTGIVLEEEVLYLPGPAEGSSRKAEARRYEFGIGAANGG